MLLRVLGLLKGETIILAMLPIAGWFLSLAFETGVLFFFDIPSSFAEVGITQAVFALSVASALFIFFSNGDTWRAWWLLTSKSAMNNLKIILFLFSMACLIFSLLVAWREGTLLTLSGITLVLFALLIVLQLFFPQKKEKKNAEEEGKDASEESMDQYGREMFQRYGRPLLSIGAAWLTAFILGYGYITGGDEFYVSADEPNYILARRYGDTYIFKEIDVSALELRGGIKIQKVGDGKELSLKRVWISALRNPARRPFLERLRFAFFGPEKRTSAPDISYHGPY